MSSDPCVAWYLVYATGWLVIQTPGPAVLGHFEFDAHPVGHRFSLDSSYCHCQITSIYIGTNSTWKKSLSCSCLLSCVYILWILRKHSNKHQKSSKVSSKPMFWCWNKNTLVSCHLLPTKTIRFSDKTYRCHPPFTSPWGTRPCSRRNRSNPMETCPWVLFSLGELVSQQRFRIFDGSVGVRVWNIYMGVSKNKGYPKMDGS